MIGRPEWFTYRIFGWGLRPRTKEGWVYILVFIALIAGIGYLPVPELYKTIGIGVVALVLVVDVLHIMMQLGKVHDERERKHQLLIERNVSFVAVVAIIAVLAYQTIVLERYDVSLLFVLGAMVIAKAGSWAWLRWKG